MSEDAIIGAPSIRDSTAGSARPAQPTRHVGLIRLLLPVVYAASVLAVVAAGASAVWQPMVGDAFEPGSGGVVLFALPIYFTMVMIGGLAGVAAGLAATGVVVGFALFGRMTWRALTVVGLINGLLGGLLLLDAANTGAGSAMPKVAPIVSLEAGMVLAPLLSVVLVLMYHYCLRPVAPVDAWA